MLILRLFTSYQLLKLIQTTTSGQQCSTRGVPWLWNTRLLLRIFFSFKLKQEINSLLQHAIQHACYFLSYTETGQLKYQKPNNPPWQYDHWPVQCSTGKSTRQHLNWTPGKTLVKEECNRNSLCKCYFSFFTETGQPEYLPLMVYKITSDQKPNNLTRPHRDRTPVDILVH